MRIINPTGGRVREGDDYGCGTFMAPRGGRLHRGLDFVCVPGQSVIAPCDCHFSRVAIPYSGEEYSGVLLVAKVGFTIKMFYLEPEEFKPGQAIRRGDMIGIAQDISVKYPGMTPHIHLEIEIQKNFIYVWGGKYFINPYVFM